MAEGDRGGGWLPPSGDDDDERERERQSGSLSSGDPLWSGSRPAEGGDAPTESTWPRPADSSDAPTESTWPRPADSSEAPTESSLPRPAEPEELPGGWQPPAGSGGSPTPPPSPGWEPPGGGAPAGQWGPAPQQGQWGGPPPQGGYYGPPQSNGKATAALICGVVGLVFCPIIFSIAALVLGYQSRSEIDASQGRQTNRGVATAGIITGWVGIAFGVLLIILFAAGVMSGLDGETDSGDPVFSEPAISLLIGALPL